MRVQRIPARHEGQKKNVAAYCRVSTLSETQEESFETQKDYYQLFEVHTEFGTDPIEEYKPVPESPFCSF